MQLKIHYKKTCIFLKILFIFQGHCNLGFMLSFVVLKGAFCLSFAPLSYDTTFVEYGWLNAMHLAIVHFIQNRKGQYCIFVNS